MKGQLAAMPLDSRQEEMRDALKRASAQVDNCDSVLVLMQKKEGGIAYFAPDSVRVESLSFLATGFVVGFHNLLEKA